MNTTEALFQFGELYRDDQGVEVWRIRDLNGEVVQDGIGSDYDAAWIAAQVASNGK